MMAITSATGPAHSACGQAFKHLPCSGHKHLRFGRALQLSPGDMQHHAPSSCRECGMHSPASCSAALELAFSTPDKAVGVLSNAALLQGSGEEANLLAVRHCKPRCARVIPGVSPRRPQYSAPDTHRDERKTAPALPGSARRRRAMERSPAATFTCDGERACASVSFASAA